MIVTSLIIAGYLLLALEILVVPGFGVPGIAGIACLAGGCALAYRWFEPIEGTAVIVGVIGLTTALMVWLPRTRLGAQVVHRGSLGNARVDDVPLAVGTAGVAESDLRPSGIARFGDVRQSVVTEAEFVTAGTPIHVAEIRGSRVVVEAATTEAGTDPAVEEDSHPKGEA